METQAKTINTPNRFDYVAYDTEAATKQAKFKDMFKELEFEVVGTLASGRAQSLIVTKLEEAYMWVGKAIRDEQVNLRSATLQETRNNS